MILSGASMSLALVPAIVESESDTPLPVDAGTPARASFAEEQRTYRTHLSQADANCLGLSPLAARTFRLSLSRTFTLVLMDTSRSTGRSPIVVFPAGQGDGDHLSGLEYSHGSTLWHTPGCC